MPGSSFINLGGEYDELLMKGKSYGKVIQRNCGSD